MKPRKKSSSGDKGRDHSYIAMVPEQERERAQIVRDKKTGNVQIFRNGLLTYDALKQIGI